MQCCPTLLCIPTLLERRHQLVRRLPSQVDGEEDEEKDPPPSILQAAGFEWNLVPHECFDGRSLSDVMEVKQERRRADSVHSKLEKRRVKRREQREKRLKVHPNQKQSPTELLLCLCLRRIAHVWRKVLLFLLLLNKLILNKKKIQAKAKKAIERQREEG